MSCCCFTFEDTLSDLTLSKTKGISYSYGQIVKFEGDPSEEEKNLFLSIVNSQKQQHVNSLRFVLLLTGISGPFCCIPFSLFCCLKQHNNTISQEMKRKAGNRKFGCKTYFGSTRDIIIELNPSQQSNQVNQLNQLAQFGQIQYNSQFGQNPQFNQYGQFIHPNIISPTNTINPMIQGNTTYPGNYQNGYPVIGGYPPIQTVQQTPQFYQEVQPSAPLQTLNISDKRQVPVLDEFGKITSYITV